MATYYADFDLATGSNDGTSWANAWQTMQRAIDGTDGTKPGPNDIVYCKGTDTLAVNLDLDGTTGTVSGGMVKWIGVNSSNINDGTRAIIDGSTKTYSCSMPAATDYWYFENFEFRQMSTSGIDVTNGSAYNVFVNCSFHDNGADGIGGTSNSLRSLFFRCTFYQNTVNGLRSGECLLIFCSFHDNTGSGAQPNYVDYSSYIGCLFYDNGDDGLTVGQVSTVFNCTIDGNTDDGIVNNAGSMVIVGNRITNHSISGSIGLNFGGQVNFHGFNYFGNNDGANIQNDTYAIEILQDGSSGTIEDAGDTNEGYTTAGSDFNLRSDASLRRTAISIPTT